MFIKELTLNFREKKRASNQVRTRIFRSIIKCLDHYTSGLALPALAQSGYPSIELSLGCTGWPVPQGRVYRLACPTRASEHAGLSPKLSQEQVHEHGLFRNCHKGE